MWVEKKIPSPFLWFRETSPHPTHNDLRSSHITYLSSNHKTMNALRLGALRVANSNSSVMSVRGIASRTMPRCAAAGGKGERDGGRCQVYRLSRVVGFRVSGLRDLGFQGSIWGLGLRVQGLRLGSVCGEVHMLCFLYCFCWGQW